MMSRHRLKTTVKWVLIGFGAVILCSMLVFAFFQTDYGKEKAGQLLERALTSQTGFPAEISGLGGLIPFHLKMKGLSFRDASGRWLRLKGVSVRLNPLALATGRLHLRDVRAASVHLLRMPERKGPAQPGPRSRRLPVQLLARLQIDRLDAHRLTLAKGVLGERVVWKIGARFMSPTPQGDRVISLSLVTSEGPRGRVLVTARLRREGSVLNLGVVVEESKTGIISRITGIKGPLKLRLRGEGPIQAWKGKLAATLGSMGTLAGEVHLEAGSEHKIRLHTFFRPEKDGIPSDLAAWLGPRIQSTLEFRLLKNGAWVVDRLTTETRRASFRLTGPLDLNQKDSSAQVALHIQELSPLLKRWNLGPAGELSIAGEVSGLTTQPQARLKLRLKEFHVGEVRADKMEGDLLLGLLGPMALPFPGLRITGKGRIEGIAHQEGKTLPESALSWEVAVEGPRQRIVEVRQLNLSGKSAALDLSGRFHAISRTGTFHMEFDGRDLRPLSRLVGIELAGAAHLKADIEADARTRSLGARVQGKVGFLESARHPVMGPLGREIAFRGDLALQGPGRLSLSKVHLGGLAWNLEGKGSMELSTGAVEGSWRLKVPQLDALATLTALDLKGSLLVDGSVNGTLQRPRMTARASTQDLAVKGVRFKEARARLALEGLPPQARGDAHVEWGEAKTKSSGKAAFAIQGPRISFSSLRIHGRGVEVDGRLVYHTDRGLAEGALKGKGLNLSVLSPLLEEKVSGAADFQLELAISGSKQVVAFDAAGKDLVTPIGKAGKMKCRGTITDPFGAASGKAELEIRDFQQKTLKLTSLKLELNGDLGVVAFKGSGKGRYVEDVEVETSGMLEITEKGRKLTLDRVNGKYSGFPLKLARRTSIAYSPNRLAMDQVEFNLGKGQVRGSGVLGQGAPGLQLQLNAIPLAVIPVPGLPALVGTVSGSIRIQDQGTWTDGDLTLDLLEVRLRDPEYADLPPARLHAKGTLRKEGLRADLVIKGLSAVPFTAEIDLPLNLTLWPPAWTRLSQGILGGHLTGRMNLAKIPALIGLDDQRLDGQMAVDLRLEGSMEAPKVSGGIRVEKASYENFRSGTILKDMVLEITAQNERLLIRRARASDGDKGSLQAQGWIDFLAEKGFPLEMTLDLNQATLLRQDRLHATVGGRLKVHGSVREPLLKGTLKVEGGEVRIPERLPAHVTELEVVEINRPPSETPAPMRNGTVRVKPSKLEVQMTCPGRVFVRGRGLDSEWRGDLKVTGTTAEPVITGTLSVVRGRYDFLGKTFKLQEGRVTFGGSTPPAPTLSVLARSSTKDLTVILRLTGPIGGPKIELTSEPALPTEEILSRFLFGREAARITPLQAVQLANALNTIGGGKFFDPLRPARQWLGLDALDIGESGAGSGEVALGVGKYLGERVYIRAERGVGAKSGKVSVEVEITPHISLKTEVGEDAEAGVGINWKWSY